MQIFRISKCSFINDLSGQGAALYGGRWNSKGKYVLYTAETASLALLETVAHITQIAAESFCMICLEIPENSVVDIEISQLPEGWQSFPPPKILRNIGDDFIKRCESLALKIPSAIMPVENNILVNPAHPDFNKVKLIYSMPLPLDGRLIKMS